MASPAPLVSVIVVNWNRRDLLANCLRSLKSQTFQDFEVIVVDNGSTDGSLELLRTPEFAHVRRLEHTKNRGFCRANNQGISISRGTFLALLNNDAEAAPEWLAELLRTIERKPGFGMAASKILVHGNSEIIDKAGHLIYPDGQNRGRGTGERDLGQYDRAEETAWPDGCAALYRRTMFDEIGGFDEDFFAYADDAELGLRARIAGWNCIYAPQAVVRHHVGSTLGEHSARRIFLIERNRVWLAAKLFPLRLLWLNPFYFAARIAATAAAALTGRGDVTNTLGSMGAFGLLQCVVKANLAALAGLPLMLAKRRRVNSFRKLSAKQTARLIRRFRIPLGDLVFKAR